MQPLENLPTFYVQTYTLTRLRVYSHTSSSVRLYLGTAVL